jgi:putative redox protein
MEIKVEHLGAVQFEVSTRGLKIISDQPTESGGHNEGMTPPELLLASLGSCAGYYAVDYLKRNGLLVDGTRVQVTAEKVKPAVKTGEKPLGMRIDNFKINVEVPRELTPEQRRGVEDAVHRCLIHNTLLSPPKIELEVKSQVTV